MYPEKGKAPFRLHCQIAYSSTVHLPTILAVIEVLDFRLLDTLKFAYFKFDLCILVYKKLKFLKMVYWSNWLSPTHLQATVFLSTKCFENRLQLYRGLENRLHIIYNLENRLLKDWKLVYWGIGNSSTVYARSGKSSTILLAYYCFTS